MKKRVRAFTLLEMLVSLALFGIVLIAIAGALSAALSSINRFSNRADNISSLIVLSRYLEKAARESWKVEGSENQVVLTTFSGQTIGIVIESNTVTVGEKRLIMKGNVIVLPVESSGRKALRLIIDDSGKTTERFFLMGYKL